MLVRDPTWSRKVSIWEYVRRQRTSGTWPDFVCCTMPLLWLCYTLRLQSQCHAERFVAQIDFDSEDNYEQHTEFFVPRTLKQRAHSCSNSSLKRQLNKHAAVLGGPGNLVILSIFQCSSTGDLEDFSVLFGWLFSWTKNSQFLNFERSPRIVNQAQQFSAFSRLEFKVWILTTISGSVS